MPPKKRVKKSRARKPVKKGLKQKQKQKQQQKVNVSVSAGGSGGGGTQFIPMPSAPAFDYAQLANLIRPAATVDVPIRAQANPQPIAARAPEPESLASELESESILTYLPKQTSSVGAQTEKQTSSVGAQTEPISKAKLQTATGPIDFPSEGEFIAPKASEVKPKRSYKRKPIAVGVEVVPEFMPARGGEFERMIIAQKELGQRPSRQQSSPTYFDAPESGTESEANVRSAYQRLKEKKKQEMAGAASFV